MNIRRALFPIVAVLFLVVAPPPASAQIGGFFKNLFQQPSDEPAKDSTTNTALDALSSEQVAAGLREALGKGVQIAVAELGRNDGFLTNVNVRIEAPKRLQRIESGLRKIGQDKIADDFILTLNRAAEQAVPAAATIFSDAVKKMTVEDAKALLAGADDAATLYFREATEDQLKEAFRPIVEKATADTGVTAAYKALMDNTGFGRKLLSFGGGADLDKHVTEQALEGLFHTIAEQELKIRSTPAARTTKTLQSVFGVLGIK